MVSTGNGRETSVLLVEDDPATALTLSDVLQERGHRVRHASTAAEAKALVEEAAPDLIILDLMLPDADGLVLCADLKTRSGAPIIICSASNQTRDRVLGLKLGADDFIGKPFDIDELEARVEAVMRRSVQGTAMEAGTHTVPPAQERVGSLTIDRGRRRVMLGNEAVQLTPTEYRLLCALAARPDEVLSREELAQQVWGYADASIGRAIDAHISRLRVKLTGHQAAPPAVVSVRGFGYKIVPEAELQSSVA
jgi:two-component system response regulator MtrA